MAVHTQCPNCKKPVPEGASACPHCGVWLQPQVHPGILPAPTQPQGSPRLAPDDLRALPDVVKQLDTAATTNITVSGVLIAFYAGAIFAGRVQASVLFNAVIYASPIVFLLITIILSVHVFYPTGYLTDDYPTLVRKKDARLRYSSLLLEISVALLALSVLVYLLRPSGS